MPPGSETGHHTHGLDYLVVYLTDGTLTVDTGTERIEATIEKHLLTSRPAGISHNVLNASEDPVEFIKVELKQLGASV